jgi:GH15 family glucan-1,4-alpha-glucosidase
MRIEDYALVGDTMAAALVGRTGSVDWLCLPRFDSAACFAKLLGGEEHGYWCVWPTGEVTATERAYRGDTLVLDTTVTTGTGTVRITDFMPVRGEHADLVRIVEGVEGRVPMRMELAVRFDYGRTVPWARRVDGRLALVAGPDALYLTTPATTRGEGLTTVADFEVGQGDRVPFALLYARSYEEPPPAVHPDHALADTIAFWEGWSKRSTYDGVAREAVMRSLITLKALTYDPTGGIVAAPTTSLPERIGGVRNWDYRYCWLRDATFTLQSLMIAGYTDEARAWRDWLLRAVAGIPAEMRTLYGPGGERFVPEFEADWLPGYEASAPVRIGNAASEQFQLDVYGEVMDALYQTRRAGIDDGESWSFECQLMAFLTEAWREPDEGIWEVRGPRRHFTHSKVMAWVAFDRAVRACEEFGREGPVDEWRATRDEIHAEVCAKGWSQERGTFVQYYGAPDVDAALLLLPLVGFLPVDDPRMVATIEAVQHDLCADGLVRRYRDEKTGVDGLPPGEGAFLACSFWLVDCLVMLGRTEPAREMFDRLAGLANDVGLMAEGYDPRDGRMLGNFPQAFSHVSLVNAAHGLSHGPHPRGGGHPHGAGRDATA